MRYELSDFEWTAIKPMLPNGPRGKDRRRKANFGLCDYRFLPLFCPTWQTASRLVDG